MALSAGNPRGHKSLGAPADILGYSIPDPASWPEWIREWFQEATEPWAEDRRNDIFLFRIGGQCQILLWDAVSAVGMVGLLHIEPEEWCTESGYPAFIFSVARQEEVTRFFERAGYRVKVLTPAAPAAPVPAPQTTRPRCGCRVVSIAEARSKLVRTKGGRL